MTQLKFATWSHLARIFSLVALTTMSMDTRSQATPVDPESLVGTWEGTWTEIARGMTGRYSLTIDKVEGEIVSGTAEMVGRKVSVPPFQLTGILSTNRLAYGKRVKTELIIDGKQMIGSTSGANDDVRINLTKRN